MYERTLSFLISACLHLLVLVLVLFWPDPEPMPTPLTGPMVSGLVSFNPLEGTAQAPARQDSPKPNRPERQTPSETPNKTVTPEPKAVEQPQAKPVENKPEKKPETVAKKPDETAKPIVDDTTKKPVQTNATAQAKPTRNATAQQKPDKSTPPPQSKPQKNATRQPSKQENVDDVLAGFQAQVAKDEKGRQRPGSGRGVDVDQVVGDLGKKVGGSGSGTQGRGAGAPGGTGYGIAGAYLDSVVSRVQPNWAWPGRTDRKNYIAVVNIQIAPDGSIQSFRLTTPSGNSFFDSSVLRAIQATKNLEAPPDPRFMNMDVSFSSDALSK